MFFFALFIPVFFAFTTPQNEGMSGGCPPPANVTLIAQSSGAAVFDWDDCSCGGNYHVYFSRNGHPGSEYLTSVSGINFSGLATGTYQFYFYTECGGETSSIIVEEIIIL